MSDGLDRVAESDDLAEMIGSEYTSNEGWTETTALLTQMEAQRQATLALVEQQRIANQQMKELIAYVVEDDRK